MKRIISALIAAVMLVTPLVCAVSASEPDSMEVSYHEELAHLWEEESDGELLFEYYVNSVFYGESAAYSTGLRTAGSQLTGDEKLAYDALVPIIKAIASGERSNTAVSVGYDINTSGGVVSADASAAFTGSASDFDLRSVLLALLLDLPYDFYWYNKVAGCKLSGYTYQNGNAAQLIFSFTVSDKFAADDVYTADTGKTGATVSAAQNAKAIVEEYKNKSDYEKLVAYKDKICDLVTYNTEAAEDSDTYFASDSDPWQMIYVFDNDPDTNVVCEGYSKAFQYLCDASEFYSDAIQCYSVTGTLISGSKGGGHMWNVLTMPDGKNYLVDVTNSDSDTDTARDLLFLKGMTKETRTFTVTVDDTSTEQELDCYVYYAGSTAIIFLYDDDTQASWGTDADSILLLSSDDYTALIYGDSNGDSIVDAVDLANIQRYIAGWTGYDDDTLTASCMDANGDGRVNPLDVIILARYIAKWPGYETLPYNP